MIVFNICVSVIVLSIVVAELALYQYSNAMSHAARNIFCEEAQKRYEDYAYMCSGVFAIALAVVVLALVVLLCSAPLV